MVKARSFAVARLGRPPHTSRVPGAAFRKHLRESLIVASIVVAAIVAWQAFRGELQLGDMVAILLLALLVGSARAFRSFLLDRPGLQRRASSRAGLAGSP
jgi:hypothetical protein